MELIKFDCQIIFQKNIGMLILGKLGELTKIFCGTDIIVRENKVYVGSFLSYNTFIAILNSMCVGVTKGYYKRLLLVGLGYRIIMLRNRILFRLGFTHYIIQYPINGIYLMGFKNKIIIYGIEEQQVNQVAATIRDFRRRDVYRGKGIRYREETVELKIGKKR